MRKWLDRIRKKASPVASAEVSIFSVAQSLPGFSEDGIGEAVYDYGIIQAALEKIAWTCASLPWRAVDDEGAEIDHPLIRRPNPDMTWHDFVINFVLQYAVSGDFYALLVRERGPESPVIAIWPLQSHLMTVKLDGKGQVSEYIYGTTNSIQTYRWQANEKAILHIRRPSIGSQTNGASVLPNAMRIGALVNELAQKLYEGLQGGLNAPAILAVRHVAKDVELGVEGVKALQKALSDHLLGGTRSGRVMLFGDVEISSVDLPRASIDPADVNVRTELRREACFLLGVPPVLLGLKDDSTYNNYETALRAFYTETVLPMYAEPLAQAMSAIMGENTNVKVMVDEIPALRQARVEMIRAVDSASFMTVNEKRAEFGLPPVDGGDAVYMPASMVPIDNGAAQAEKSSEGDGAALWVIDGGKSNG